jgi:hypothetical protein
MAVTFSRSLRSLQADRSRLWTVELALGLLLAGWLAWFLLGQVAVYEVTERARLEAKSVGRSLAVPHSFLVVPLFGRYLRRI